MLIPGIYKAFLISISIYFANNEISYATITFSLNGKLFSVFFGLALLNKPAQAMGYDAYLIELDEGMVFEIEDEDAAYEQGLNEVQFKNVSASNLRADLAQKIVLLVDIPNNSIHINTSPDQLRFYFNPVELNMSPNLHTIGIIFADHSLQIITIS